MKRLRPYIFAVIAAGTIRQRLGFVSVQESNVVIVSHPVPRGNNLGIFQAEVVAVVRKA